MTFKYLDPYLHNRLSKKIEKIHGGKNFSQDQLSNYMLLEKVLRFRVIAAEIQDGRLFLVIWVYLPEYWFDFQL